MPAAALSFNDTIVKESLATQPSPKVLAEVRQRLPVLACAACLFRTHTEGQPADCQAVCPF